MNARQPLGKVVGLLLLSLTLVAGEFTMILVPTEQDGKVQYVVTNGLLAGLPLTFAQADAGVATIGLGAGVEQYIFTRSD